MHRGKRTRAMERRGNGPQSRCKPRHALQYTCSAWREKTYCHMLSVCVLMSMHAHTVPAPSASAMDCTTSTARAAAAMASCSAVRASVPMVVSASSVAWWASSRAATSSAHANVASPL